MIEVLVGGQYTKKGGGNSGAAGSRTPVQGKRALAFYMLSYRSTCVAFPAAR